MREITFRAWSKMREEMFNVSWISWGEHTLGDGAGMTLRFSDVKGPMQFTGLHDKNGREIYEGDLVKVHDDTVLAHQREYVQKVEMHNGCWRPTMMFVNGNEVEIVGNIYQDGHLLK